MNSSEKDNEIIRSLIVFDPTVRGKYIESRIACEDTFAAQPIGHKDTADFCLTYHSGSELFSQFCIQHLNVEFLSKETKQRPTHRDEEVELVFNNPFHCESAKNGISIEVKTTTTKCFVVDQKQGHFIKKGKSVSRDFESYALDLKYRHADFYLLIKLKEPDDNTEVHRIFGLVEDLWVVPTFRLEQELLKKKESSSIDLDALNEYKRKMGAAPFPTNFTRPNLIAFYLRRCVDDEVSNYGSQIAEHKRSIDNSKANANKKKSTHSTISDM